MIKILLPQTQTTPHIHKYTHMIYKLTKFNISTRHTLHTLHITHYNPTKQQQLYYSFFKEGEDKLINFK
jgi:hypothetical protein